MAVETISKRLMSTPGQLKRIVLCLDGTWNTDDGRDITNVVKIRDLIDPKYASPDGKEVWAQRVYYETGVGTGLAPGDKYIGGVTGAGLEENIRHAYRFLSGHYSPGVEIYLFGFSRGAFTARSLAGYIGASGLLKPECCTQENEERTWAFYRTPPGDRFPSEQRELGKLCFDSFRISCLGVFDTVGARGIPTELLHKLNRRKYGFHDVALGANVDHALHALAIDEKRGPFGASVWQYPNHRDNLSVEQVWFPGVHSNIGGGYSDSGISDLALEWMLSRIEAKGIGLRLKGDWRDTLSSDALGQSYDSRTFWYVWSRISPKIRVINQSPIKLGGLHRLSRLAPHAPPIGEMLHWSALYRWTISLSNPNATLHYNPVNLQAAVDAMLEPLNPRRLPVVGRSGNILNWYGDESHRSEFLSLLPPSYQKRTEDALAIWETGGVDMSTFLDASGQLSSPLARRAAMPL
jgi:hypothetical protein